MDKLSHFIISSLFILTTVFIGNAQTHSENADTTARTLKALADSAAMSETLNEVTVVAETVKHDGITDSYLVTKKMLTDTHDAADLLGKISGMYYNPITKDLSYLGSKNVIILVDSVSKDQDYIKRLNPNRFTRISVINKPTGEYEDYDVLINLVTKESYVGYDGINVTKISLRPSHNYKKDLVAIIKETFEATYTKDKWNFAFSGSYNRLNENNKIWYEKQFPYNNYIEKAIQPPLNKPNRKVEHDNGNINLWVDYRISNQHTISVGLKVAPSDSKVKENVMLLYGNPDEALSESSQITSDRQPHYLITSPSLQYRGIIRKWTVNASLQYTNTTFDRRKLVERESFSMEDNRNAHTKYLWGGMTASRRFFGKLTLTLTDYVTLLRYKEMDLSGKPLSSSKDFRNRFRVSFQYRPSKNVSMGINGGMNITHSKSGVYSDTQVLPTLGANFTYSNPDLLIRLNHTTSVQNPPISWQQDYGRFTDSLIYHHGNPRLNNKLSHRLSVMTNFMCGFTLSGEYNYIHNAIYDIAGLGDGLRPDGIDGYYVAYQYQNGKSTSVKANITYTKSFNFGLTLSATGSIVRQKASYREFSIAKTQPHYDWYVMYNFKSRNLRCVLSNYLVTELYVTPQHLGWSRSDHSEFQLRKFFNNDKIELTLVWALPIRLMKRGLESITTTPMYIEKYNYGYRINDNYLSFIFQWRFNGGKKTRKYNRQTESVEI